jgi:hypothetical protein
MSFFPQNWRTGGKNRSCLGREVALVEGGGGEYGANTVHTFVSGKMRPVETIPEMGE